MKKGELDEIREIQLKDIQLSRIMMAEILCEFEPERVLVIGEGTSWESTWTGFCARLELFPDAIKQVTVIDIRALDDSVFRKSELWEKHAVIPLLGDATSLPFASETFDMIVSPLMIDDCQDHHALVIEMHRCLCTGAIGMISGHGLDITDELKGIPEIIGSTHQYQCDPALVDQYAVELKWELLVTWQNSHAWLRAFRKI